MFSYTYERSLSEDKFECDSKNPHILKYITVLSYDANHFEFHCRATAYDVSIDIGTLENKPIQTGNVHWTISKKSYVINTNNYNQSTLPAGANEELCSLLLQGFRGNFRDADEHAERLIEYLEVELEDPFIPSWLSQNMPHLYKTIARNVAFKKESFVRNIHQK